MASSSSISDGSIADARVEPGSPSDAEDRDAFDDDEYFEEFERETTVTRPSDEDDMPREGSIIDASLDVLSRLSMRLSGALGKAPSGASGRGSIRLSFLGGGRKGFDGDGDAEGGSASIAMTSPSSLHSASPGANASETAAVINALHGMMDTDVAPEHEHDHDDP
jgi:hypothetical protein